MWAFSDSSGIQVHHIRNPDAATRPATRRLSMEVGTNSACGSMLRPVSTATAPSTWRRTSSRKQQLQSSSTAEEPSPAGNSTRAAAAANNMVCSKRAFTGGERDRVAVVNQDAAAAVSNICTAGATAASTPTSAATDCTTSVSAFCTSDRTLFSDSNVSCSATGSGLDDRGYDPEALLLEPLLPSPRSSREARESRGVGQGGSGELALSGSLNNACDSGLADSSSNIMVSQHPGVSPAGGPASLSSTSWDQDTATSSAVLSSPAFLSPPHNPLVPISPTHSAVQGQNMPFLPVGDSRLPLSAGNSGGNTDDNSNDDGGWYLKLPPHIQAQQSPNQQQHHGDPSATTAAAVAAAAANVAAAIQQASMPFVATGGSGYAPLNQQQISSNSHLSSSRSSPRTTNSASANRGAACNIDRARQSSWQSLARCQRNNAQVRTSSGGSGNGTAANPRGGEETAISHQRPRFVTKEECVPATHAARSTTRGAGGGSPHPEWRKRNEVTSGPGVKRSLHGGLNESPASYAQSCSPTSSGCAGDSMSPGDACSGNEAVHGWQSGRPDTMSGRGAKRLHSQAAFLARETDGISGDGAAVNNNNSETQRNGRGGTKVRTSGLRTGTVGAGGRGNGSGKRIKIGSSPDGSSSSLGWGNNNRTKVQSEIQGRNGWGGARNISHPATISPAEMHRICPANSLISSAGSAPRRRSTRSLAGAASANATAARAAASAPTSRVKRDDNSTEDDEESVQDGEHSSPDWAERDSEGEEAGGGGAGGGRTMGNGGGNSKTSSSIKVASKTPFKLDPRLWVVVERRAVCTAKQCAYRR